MAGIVAYAFNFNVPSGTATNTVATTITQTDATPSGIVTVAQSQTTTVTYTANAPVPTPTGCSLAKTLSSRGYRLEVYLPSVVRAGDTVCMLFIVYNVNHIESSGYSGYDVNVTDANGNVIDQTGCVLILAPGDNGGFPVGQQGSCETGWNTALPSRFNGLVPQPGIYHVTVTVGGLSITADADVSLTG